MTPAIVQSWDQVVKAVGDNALSCVFNGDDLQLAALTTEVGCAVGLLLPEEPTLTQDQSALAFPNFPGLALTRAKREASQLAIEAGKLGLQPTSYAGVAESLLDPKLFEHLALGPAINLGLGLAYASSVHRGRVLAEVEAQLVLVDELAADQGHASDDLPWEAMMEVRFFTRAWPALLKPTLRLLDVACAEIGNRFSTVPSLASLRHEVGAIATWQPGRRYD